MPTITVLVSDEQKQFAEKQIAAGRHANMSEYVSDLIRKDALDGRVETIDPELEATLLAALDEGPATPFTAQDWEGIRERGMARAAARRQKEADAER